LKKLINDFIKQNESVLEFLDSTGRDYENADKVVSVFADEILRSNFNSAYGIDFANVLQLLNNEEIISQYSLTDISRLFTSLITLQEFNLDTYVEAAHYEWAVMDNTDTAKVLINQGLDNAKRKIAELERLLATINKE
jgi:hypothetical protein